MTNKNKGISALAIIGIFAAVAVVGAGVYYFINHNNSNNQILSPQTDLNSVNNTDQNVTNQNPSIITNTNVVSTDKTLSFTCSSASSIINSIAPTINWKASSGPQPSKTLNCSYAGFGPTGLSGIFSVWLDQNLPTVTQALNDFQKTAPGAGFNSINCNQTSFLAGSWECSWIFNITRSKVPSPKTDINGISTTFVSSDGKYTVGIGLGLNSGVDKKTVEQIAKEIDSKI